MSAWRVLVSGPALFGSGRRAIVLVLVLWVVIVLGIIASSLAFDVQVSSKLTLIQREQFIAYNLAKSAIAVGMTHLQNDLLIEQQENPNQLYDAPSDVWAQPGRREKDIEVEIDKEHKDRSYEVEVADEEGKIPLNNASPRLLKGLLEFYGYEAPDSDEVAAAIVDYRDQDDMCASAPGEKENEHYSAALGQRISNNMDSAQLAYQCPNEPFMTVEQLLDVYGIQPEVFYGYDPAESEARDLKTRDAIAEGRKAPRQRQRKGRKVLPMKDVVSVSTQGRVNLNTAPVEVLTVLIYAANNFASIDSAHSAAEAIAEFRGDGRRGRIPNEEDAFKSLPDVAKVPGVDANALNQLGGMGVQPSFHSEIFSVLGIGKTARAQRTITAVVERKLEVFDPNSARLSSNKNGRTPARRVPGSRRKKGGEQQDDYIRVPAVRVLQWID
ncbi:MAG: general secretion pathway protein GspK [Candidatus Sumerlaeaceae bacterium]